MTTKSQVLEALTKFANSRPGLEFGNYGNVKSYRAELRQITKDLHHALELLNSVAWRDSITAEHIIEASQHAFSGRLSIIVSDSRVSIDYCAGQYYPTEYRKAVCAVLASVMWDYLRTPESTGDSIRKAARRELSQSVCRSYFR